mmetsp:Transcript_93798/g.227889  ORF Transcript_93798/g.227889 Transcript_93798/m.227889 type:complete len:226 (+) Transcript_93798:175-852(+)
MLGRFHSLCHGPRRHVFILGSERLLGAFNPVQPISHDHYPCGTRALPSVLLENFCTVGKVFSAWHARNILCCLVCCEALCRWQLQPWGCFSQCPNWISVGHFRGVGGCPHPNSCLDPFNCILGPLQCAPDVCRTRAQQTVGQHRGEVSETEEVRDCCRRWIWACYSPICPCDDLWLLDVWPFYRWELAPQLLRLGPMGSHCTRRHRRVSPLWVSHAVCRTAEWPP